VVASLLCVWYAFSLWYLGVVPFLRGRPKLYDLLEDQIRVIYKDGTTLSIDFSEIAGVRLVDEESMKARSFFRKLVDPFGRVSPAAPITFSSWVRDIVLNILPPYSFGFGSGHGEIHITLNAGYRLMRAIFPWWNTPVRSRDLSIHPFDGKQFFSQFQVAFAKWKKQKL